MHIAEYIDRRQQKAETAALLKEAQVRPRAFFLLYLLIVAVIDVISSLSDGGSADSSGIFSHPVGIFVSVLATLISLILGVGCCLYCFGIRRGERVEYLTLFDGFSFAGKVILLYLVELGFTILWMCLLIVPGIIALYSYRFAVLNLCENPSMSVMQAINMSKRQTYGYKGQLFMLDLSYIGWSLLANAPVIYFNYASAAGTIGAYAVPGANMNPVLQAVIVDVFFLVFSLVYLPHLRMTEIGYFGIAKRTSGVGAGMQPSDQEEHTDSDF